MTQKEKDFLRMQEEKKNLTDKELQELADIYFEKEITKQEETQRWNTFI